MNHPSRSYKKWGWVLAAVLVTWVAAFSGELYAAEGNPDFYLMMKHHKNVACNMQFPEGSTSQKGPQIEFGVVFDVPPSLLLANKHSSDFVAIDSAKHSAVVITRLLENEYAGSKVCHGVFVTAYEMEKLLQLEGDRILHPK